MAGFFLLLRVKCEERDVWREKKMLSIEDLRLSIWEILRLSRLLKLGDSLPRKHAPDRATKV